MTDSQDKTRENAFEQMLPDLGSYLDSQQDHLESIPETSSHSLYKEVEELLERYQNPVCIGTGGMKKIFNVTDRMTDRPVAMAVMHKIKKPEIIEQFLKEARLTASLEHPNIMPIYDVGLDEVGEPFFTMKLIKGETLGHYLKGLSPDAELQKYELNNLLNIFVKICDAVSYAHSKEILHLDLKPDNIQIGDFGEVLVCDWGLARYNESSDLNLDIEEQDQSGLTHYGSSLGTPGYMGPEQVTQSRDKLTRASDIYSLGAILYSILTHFAPIEGDDPKAIMEDTVRGKISPPSLRCPDLFIPESLEAVCMKALQVDPAKRYPDAEAMKNEILQYNLGFATQAEEAGFFKNLVLLSKRHSLLSSVLIGAFLAINGIIAFSIILLQESEKHANQNAVQAEFNAQEAARHAKEAKKNEALATQRAKQAIENLTNFMLEKRKRQHLARQATPLIMDELMDNLKELKFGKALDNLQQAVRINPENMDLRDLQAFFLLGQKQYAAAGQLFRNSKRHQFHKYASIMETFDKENVTTENLLGLMRELQKDGYSFAIIQMLISMKNDFASFEDKFNFCKQVIKILNPGQQDLHMVYAITRRELFVNMSSNQQLQDIRPLICLDIHHLNLAFTNVQTLDSLKTMPLRTLNLKFCNISDLSALQNLKLESLDISGSLVHDLSPLRNSRLQQLIITDLNIQSLQPLVELRTLRYLLLSRTSKNLRLLQEAKLPTTTRIIFR